MVKLLYLCSRLVQYFFLFLSFGGMSMSDIFLVGDEGGWNSGINFATWSQNHNFTKGDFLVFNYAKGVHNVFEVNEETYRSCNTTTSNKNGAVLGEYESGNDRIELKEARKYWFICNVAGHCLGGMRFGIEVKQANSSTNPVQSPPPPTPSHGSKSNIGIGRYSIWSGLICVTVFEILFG